jgi:hypothetical protein
MLSEQTGTVCLTSEHTLALNGSPSTKRAAVHVPRVSKWPGPAPDASRPSPLRASIDDVQDLRLAKLVERLRRSEF